MYRLTRVDADGVPTLVQSLKYEFSIMCFKATLFNDSEVTVVAEFASPSIGITQRVPTDEQYTEAEIKISAGILDETNKCSCLRLAK